MRKDDIIFDDEGRISKIYYDNFIKKTLELNSKRINIISGDNCYLNDNFINDLYKCLSPWHSSNEKIIKIDNFDFTDYCDFYEKLSDLNNTITLFDIVYKYNSIEELNNLLKSVNINQKFLQYDYDKHVLECCHVNYKNELKYYNMKLSIPECKYFNMILNSLCIKEDSIMLINFPELGLHCDIQEKLIDNILKICGIKLKQLIVYTQSPSIIINGWNDCVSELLIDDQKDYQLYLKQKGNQ